MTDIAIPVYTNTARQIAMMLQNFQRVLPQQATLSDAWNLIVQMDEDQEPTWNLFQVVFSTYLIETPLETIIQEYVAADLRTQMEARQGRQVQA